MNEITSTTPEDSSEPSFDRLKVWKEYEQVAMHFNDLLMRLRTQSLAAIGAVATLAGIVLTSEGSVGLRWATLAGVFSLLIFFWVAVWILDFVYYNRLLGGAVDALLEIESESPDQKRVPQLTLSTRIEAAVAGASRAAYWTRAKAWWLFYSVVFGALVTGLIVSMYAVGGIGKAFAALTSEEPAIQPALKGEAALTRRELFDRRRLCMDIGERRFATDSKELGRVMSGIRPTFCFSERLNTCLYSSGYIGKDSSILMVADLLANKDLASSVVSNGRVISGMQGDAYQKQSDELLSTCTQ